MQCFRHTGSGAIAICVGCGRAICAACIVDAEGAATCSNECALRATISRKALDLIARKTLRSNLVTARMCWLIGGVFLGIGVLFGRGGEFGMALFPGAMGVVFLIVGVWYHRVSQRDN